MPKRSVFAKWLATPDPNPAVEAPPTVAGLPMLVVGAGPAGLSGMAMLAKQGIDFVGIDSHSHVGGIWDISNPVSSAYEGLRTVTSRFTTYVGTPVSKDWPKFIPHEMALGYLTDFAKSRGLIAKIKFGTLFVDARKSASGTWIATLRPTGEGQEYEQEFRGIVFATGAHNKKLSRVPEELSSQARAAGIDVLHSAEYKSPTRFAGKRVLIVGLGDSGSDIAPKICSTASRTLLAVRSTPWLIPQVVMGVPVDKLGFDTKWLPTWYSDNSFHVIRRAYIGGYRRLGMPRPKQGLHDKTAIIDRGIVSALRSGKVIARSHVVSLAGGTATFANPDHEPEQIDAVMFATGFGREYPLLCQPGASVDEVANALGFRIFHPTEPGLFYLAETVGLRSCWPIFAEQANAIAAYLLGEARGTSNVRRFNARRQVATPSFKGVIFSMADNFHHDYEIYTHCLRDLSGWLAE
ncbi:MAG: FAD-dependent oxidoreductase [Planctomycetota bacterium]|nr:FAD-dependent oxidoreductase [Planctomycetota bacterium]